MGHYQDTLTFLKTFRANTGVTGVLVACSGGKDSIVTLGVCSEVFDKVVGFQMSLLPGLECMERLVRPVEQRGFHVLRLQHPDLSGLLKYGVYAPHSHEAFKLPQLRLPDIENIAREQTGLTWIASGHRKLDSLQRRAMLSKCSLRDYQARRLYPIGEWNEKEVYAYLRAKRWPLPARFGLDGKMSGLELNNARCLDWLRKTYPDDLKKIMEVFPWTEALLFKLDRYPDSITY